MSEGKLKEEDKEPNVSGFEFYLDSFYELDSCRHIGMGPGPIPFYAVKQYYDTFLLDGLEDFQEFLYFIRRMDNSYLEAILKKEAKGRNGSKTDKRNSNKGSRRGNSRN